MRGGRPSKGLTLREQTLFDFQMALKNGSRSPTALTLTQAFEERLVNDTTYLNVSCAPGYQGALCAVCADGWGRGKGLECAPCPPEEKNTGYYILILCANFVSLIITSARRGPPPCGAAAKFGQLS